MRKYQRALIKALAVHKKTSPSKFLKAVWDRLQIQMVGAELRKARKKKGSRYWAPKPHAA